MTLDEMKELFDKHEDEYLCFEGVENKLSNRPDIHAFILLDKIQPKGRDMVSAADHDEIYLDTDVEEFAMIATESQVVELIRCGLRFDEGIESFCMFV